ncbi:MAG: hypothetical protein Q4D73_07550, partial [Actinomycetaceae bacterium]|nr:hypothetical protein [Actinomycetaceae bacterium]
MTSKSLELTWQWSAVRLLGESLYSNQAAALSELIANSLDADAKHVGLVQVLVSDGWLVDGFV